MAETVYDIGVGTAVDIETLTKALKNVEKQLNESVKKQNTILNKGNKNTTSSFQKTAGDISKSLTGIDFSKLLIPGAVVGMSIAALTKLKGALDDCAAMYREQEKAEIALQNAAKNNPYLNERSTKQLISFVNEMQRLTGVDNVMATQTASRLASLGRNQEQIQKIMKTAADMAAAGVMSFDEAVSELNNGLNGMIRTSGRLYPELKKLSKEALAAGEGIDIIAGKVAGSAAEAMKTGAGSVTAYQNAVSNLKKIYGADWEKVTRGLRNALTDYINKVVKSKQETREWRKAVDALKDGTAETADRVTVLERELENAMANMNTEILTYARNSQDVFKQLEEGADLSTIVFETHNEIARERLETIRNEVVELQKTNNSLKERLEIENKINDIVELTESIRNKTSTKQAANIHDMALKSRIGINQRLNAFDREAARNMANQAENLRALAEAELKRWEDEQRAAEERAEREKANAEKRQEILDNLEKQKQADPINITKPLTGLKRE